jgi:hypothetical protein
MAKRTIEKIKIKLLTKIEYLMYDLEYFTSWVAGWCKRKRWDIEGYDD